MSLNQPSFVKQTTNQTKNQTKNQPPNQFHIEMNQATTTSADPLDVEALRLQLEEDRKVYCDYRSRNRDGRERLLHTLQTNDCREIIADIVDGNVLANVFVEAGDEGHVDILERFLDHGMNVDIKDKSGWTALMYASCSGQEECVRFLLEHNAKVDVQEKVGNTALMYASQFSKTKIVEILLEKNANPDIQNYNGVTALMCASRYGYKEMVQVLLNHGVDIELKDREGKTALDLTKNEEIKERIQNHVTASYLLK